MATEIGDPARGSAAPSRGTRRNGVLERLRHSHPLRAGCPHYARRRPQIGRRRAVLPVMSALQGEGAATGIAAAANAVDVGSRRGGRPRQAVEEWSATVGTRRLLLGGISPWCEGAVRALEQARE